MEAMLKKISARFPEELLDEMDLIASLEQMDRTELMKVAIRDYLKRVLKDEEFKEKITESYLENRLSFKKLELILGKEDALAVKASKKLMEHGEKLARKLA